MSKTNFVNELDYKNLKRIVLKPNWLREDKTQSIYSKATFKNKKLPLN